MVKIYVNYARVIADCPKCKLPINTAGLADKHELVCPQCTPGAYENGMVPVERILSDGTKNVIWKQTPDYVIRAQAIADARAKGKVYPIEYPEDLEQIINALHSRPREFQNMDIGQTLKDILRENAEGGLKP